MTTSVSRPLTIAETIFRDVFWKPLVMSGEIALDEAVPFLNAPVLHQVEQVVIDAVADAVFNWLVLRIDVGVIRFTNSEYQKNFDDLSIKLKILAHEKGLDSDEYRKAREDAKATLSRFTDVSIH